MRHAGCHHRRHNWTFAGSDRGGERAAAIYTLIETCKLCDVEPRAWLADVLSRLPNYPASRIEDLLPWELAEVPTQLQSRLTPESSEPASFNGCILPKAGRWQRSRKSAALLAGRVAAGIDEKQSLSASWKPSSPSG